MQRRRVLVMLCLVLAVVPACKKASESSAEKAVERAMERATGNKADVNISGEAALPKSFPEDVPRYPGAGVLSSMSQGNAMSMVTLQTGDASDRVYEFYGAKLRDAGWDIANEVSAGQMRMISGRKDERQANITVIGGEGKCTITIVYSDGKG